MTPEAVVKQDLDYICQKLADELAMLSGKHLLVTGGAGFLGYYLVQAMLHWNQQSRDSSALPIYLDVFDNFSRGMPPWLLKLAQDPLRGANLSLVRHDITQPLPGDFGPYEYVIHAASIASPIFYRQHPIATMDANVNGLRALLDWSVEQANTETPVQSMLYFSTSEIYGDPPQENIPTAETYRGNVSCTGPRACYDESKRFGETLCVSFTQVHSTPVKIARPFNNYGPGLKINDGRALPDFAQNVMAGKDITLYSDGTPTRTFCYVADAIVGYIKVLLRGRDGESYNIGTDDNEISIRDLAKLVASTAGELFDYNGRVKFAKSSDAEYLTDNPNRRCPIIDKARTELDYNPGIKLEDGMRRSLSWYAGNLDVDASQ